jgi:putative SOS response-associated peptidase YedK
MGTMCSRLCLATDINEIRTHFRAMEGNIRLRPHWNICAGHLLPVVRLNPYLQRRRLVLMRWGLIPPSAKSAVIVRVNLSARQADGTLDELLQRPSRRCLILVDNFYEWRISDGQPFAVALANRQIMSLAGVWGAWMSPAGEEIAGFAILTTETNKLTAPLCKQMPVIVFPQDWDLWLGGDPPDGRVLLDVLQPCSDELLSAWPVGRRIRSTKNDDPDVLAAIAC